MRKNPSAFYFFLVIYIVCNVLFWQLKQDVVYKPEGNDNMSTEHAGELKKSKKRDKKD